jgi:uncharacterized protein (DUF58 family)
MHLAQRAYALIVLTALLAVAGIWSNDPALDRLWLLPAALLLAGIAFEGFWMQRTRIAALLDAPRRVFLGRSESAALELRHEQRRDVDVEYAPATPSGFDALGAPRRVRVPPDGLRDPLELHPVRLGPQRWPRLPARVLGRLGFCWWSRELAVDRELLVAPDTLRAAQRRPLGALAGQRARRIVGAGAELHQLRAYVAGDPISRIDWKASARGGELITREYSEDQHLDILLLVDAGRLSRIRAGALDRLGLYANLAARFAQRAVEQDDRVGLLVFADRPLTASAPGRGTAAVMRIRALLEQLAAQPTESDVVAAAVRARALLKRRSLVILLTDLDDATIADQLARAVRLLAPPHLTLVAGVRSPEIAALARNPARGWRGPWVALAASEHEARARAQLELLHRLGAPVVAAREELLEAAVFDMYEALRRRRRV